MSWNQDSPDMTGSKIFDDEMDNTKANLQHLKDATYTGWNPALTAAGAAQTWTYLSASSIRIADAVDYTTTYPIGTAMRLAQATGGTKYFKVVSASYSAPNFDIVLDSFGLYTVANEAITAPCFSLLQTPPGLFVNTSGWETLFYTCAYSSADDPTYVMQVTGGDLTGKLSAGMRFRCYQTTGGTKYFIITKVALSGSDTLVTIFGGTGASSYNLENEAIIFPYFSSAKAPFGFPVDPTVWRVIVTDTTNANQNSPTQNQWYNLGTVTLSVPIGMWDLRYKAVFGISTNGAITTGIGLITLSTANNSESDPDFTLATLSSGASGNMNINAPVMFSKAINIASKTSYYLNTSTTTASVTNISNRGDRGKTILEARCAYL